MGLLAGSAGTVWFWAEMEVLDYNFAGNFELISSFDWIKGEFFQAQDMPQTGRPTFTNDVYFSHGATTNYAVKGH